MIPPFKADDGKDYYVVSVSQFQSDSLKVVDQFHGRDWRRIKRELRKLNDRYRFNPS